MRYFFARAAVETKIAATTAALHTAVTMKKVALAVGVSAGTIATVAAVVTPSNHVVVEGGYSPKEFLEHRKAKRPATQSRMKSKRSVTSSRRKKSSPVIRSLDDAKKVTEKRD